MSRTVPTRLASRTGIALGIAIGLAPAIAWGAAYTPCSGPGPGRACVFPIVGPAIPTPPQVPGKEYSRVPDEDFMGAPAPGQNVAWDGIGGTVDSFLYAAAEVDAMANNTCALYDPVIADQAALLFSVDLFPDVMVEPIAAAGGAAAGAVWAVAPVHINSMAPAADLDALEVWGPDGVGPSDDAIRYSDTGDPGRVAVFAHPGGAAVCSDLVLASSMAPLLGLSPIQTAFLEDNMDVDAMMIDGGQVDDEPPTKMMWSVRPILIPPDGPFPAVALDGGEIFVADCLGTPAAFLFHGGHLWDTAFPVAATFGLPSENVNALEAISEDIVVPALPPAALPLVGGLLAGITLLVLRRRAARR